MRSIDLDRRRLERLRTRVLGGRISVQIVLGALAIAAIVLAFLLRPGQSSEGAKQATLDTSAKPTAVASAAPAAIPPPTVTPAPSKERTHVVAAGDTLSSIAEKYYGDASKYAKIFDANKDVLKSPDSLQVGQRLKIPD